MNPYKLPCNHTLCLIPCIAPNDRATVVACPLCQLRCYFKDITPDKNLCERALAYIMRQSLHVQSPYHSPHGYQLNDNGSSCEREGIPTRDIYQQSQGLSGIPSPNNVLPLSQPQKCELCNSMVFGLYYISALQASMCASCRDKRFDKEVDAHLDKIDKIREHRELDTAIQFLFKKLEESRLKAEKELRDHNATIEDWLREMHTKMSKIAPEVKRIPDLVKELEKSGAGVKEWLEMGKKILNSSKGINQAKEGIVMRGTEKYEFNPEGANSIKKALERLDLISDQTTFDYCEPPTNSCRRYQDYYNSSTDFKASSRSRSPLNYSKSPRDLPSMPTTNVGDLFS
ncbi:unnamed protein product [Hymenolepis diminuta]|uniref:RING-type domain-containing protein n=1 Tax=Hymenolepis diminuta TaxID=6216 RepID=A0A564Y558_HYMDI|nr:unnamed protein product [Hymenolepis diminuta]